MNIGDLFLQLLADGSKLTPSVQKEAAKAGDAGAQTLGQKLAGGLKTNGLKVFAGAASAAFAVATKGALDLEEVQARITAETGAGADEAKAAAKAINAAAGTERLSLNEVADAASKVRTDLAATGPVADRLTAKFARFGRVTKQGPAAAVADFDDILDAYGLKVDDIDGLMDKLIVSHQKYGGVIADDQKALAGMAPQLKAFNLGIDDGIALLDLFKASGLDAASIPKALNSALQKLDGRPLTDFVAELAAIEDPGERAQRAIEVFGAKAGVGLANAIKPGMTSLADLGITAEDSTGALDKAADALDSTFGARFQRMLSEARAKLREFGADFGPFVTGLASLASLGGALGLDKLLGKAFDALKSSALVKSAAKTTGAVVGGFFSLAFSSAEKLGGYVVDAVSRIAGKLGVKAAATSAGALLGALFSSAFATAERFGASVTGALLKLPGVAKLRSGIASAGSLLGTTFGKAFGLAAAAGAVLWFLDEWNKQRAGIAAQSEQIGADIAASIARGNLAELKRERDTVRQALEDLAPTIPRGFNPLAPFQTLLASDAIDKLRAKLDDLDATIAALEGGQPIGVDVEVKPILGPPVPAAIASGAQAGKTLGQIVGTKIAEFAQASLAERIVLIGHTARLAGAQVALDTAAGLRSARSNVQSAIDQLREDMKNRLSPRKEVALRIGQLFSRTLAKGLHDADPVIRKQAEGTRALIEDQLIETIKAGGQAGQKIQEELEKKLKSKDPAVRAQAQRTKSLVDAALKAQPARTPGEVIGDQLNADLRDKGTTLGRTAYDLGRTIARNLIAGVQGTGAVPPSSGGGGGGGAKKAETGDWRVQGDQLMFIHDREMIVPAAQSDAIRSGTATLGVVPLSTAISVGPINVDARGATNPRAVGQAVMDAVTDGLRTQTARLPVGTRS